MDETVWHKSRVLWPRRGVDGKWLFDRVWRRKTPHGWEYQHRDPTFEEISDEAW